MNILQLNNLVTMENEPRIVMLDYETAGLEYLSDSFVDLLKATLEISEPIIKELKPWQKKMYKME